MSLGDLLNQCPEDFLPDLAKHSADHLLPRSNLDHPVSLYASVMVSIFVSCYYRFSTTRNKKDHQGPERQIHTIHIRRFPVLIQVVVSLAHLEARVVSSEVIVAKPAGRLARADILSGVEECGRVSEAILLEGLEDEQLGVDDRPELL